MAQNKNIKLSITTQDKEDEKQISKLFHYLWGKAKENDYEKSVWIELQKLLNKKGINV